MSTETIVLLIIVIFIIGIIPSWPHSKSWGYAPMSVLSLILVIFIIWAIMGERPLFRNVNQSVETSLQNAGQEIKELGRDVADSVSRVTQ